MATIAATQPHPIYLAGRWVESSDVLEVSSPGLERPLRRPEHFAAALGTLAR